MDVKFPFEEAEKSFFGVIQRPIAKVSFKSLSGNIWTDIWMVVDTGADFTILPRYFSQDLGISLEDDCVADKTRGVGGEQTIYLCKLKIKARIGSFDRQVPLAFFDSNEVPSLLGRLGFLETFDVLFLRSHYIVFQD